MKTAGIAILFCSAIVLTGFIFSRSMDSKNENPVHQLRIYEVPKDNLQFFHARFNEHAMRIMKQYGFKIIATWESVDSVKAEFIYLLEWNDEKSMKTAWSKFMMDEEWKEIKAKTSATHGTYVESIGDRTLILTPYSPTKKFVMDKK